MEVRHGFASIGAVVEDEAVTVFVESKLLCNLGSFNQQMTQHLVIVRMRLGNARDWFLRDDQDVNGRLRFDIVKRDDLIVLINDFGRYFARYDFLK